MIPIILMTIENDDDREFMIKLYMDYQSLMRKQVLFLLKDTSLTDDMINETCIKLIENLDVLKQINCWALPTYIVFTVRSAVLDYMKSKRSKKIQEVDETDREHADESINTEAEAIRQIEMSELASLINKLPDKYKDVLNFKYYLNMTNKEIASRLGIKPESVDMYLTRARKKVAELYRRKGKNEHD